MRGSVSNVGPLLELFYAVFYWSERAVVLLFSCKSARILIDTSDGEGYKGPYSERLFYAVESINVRDKHLGSDGLEAELVMALYRDSHSCMRAEEVLYASSTQSGIDVGKFLSFRA
jgi:hypothetical protein